MYPATAQSCASTPICSTMWAQAMATSYAAKTGRPVDAMLALLTDGADHWYTAETGVGH